MKNKNKHLTYAERQIIETGIRNGSSKKALADTLGKDKSTIGKEIKTHRFPQNTKVYEVDCAKFQKCKNRGSQVCDPDCPDYCKFYCKRRDRSPGACNGCETYQSCRYQKYKYTAQTAEAEYKETLVVSREGVNATQDEIRDLGKKIKPLLEQGQSVYVILNNHPEITLSEKTIYNYIENGVFQEAGVQINCMSLKRQVRRKMPKKKRNQYKPRTDRSYLLGRKNSDYEAYMAANPNARVVEMDTVYNDISNGPFLQTFLFVRYDLLFAVYHDTKTAQDMLDGIDLLEKTLGHELFRKEVEVLRTDRGSEFQKAEEAEIRPDGVRRTNLFYCDAMASWQKSHVEHSHLMLREICPNEVDLRRLGLTDQNQLNIALSHINSYAKEALNGKSSLELTSFLSPELSKKLKKFGLKQIDADQVTLKPYLFKQK